MVWYEKWAAIVITAAIGVAGYNGIPWGRLGIVEWAYWIQALGSILAILGAAWVAGDQYRKQIRDRKLANTMQASICCDNAESTYEEVARLIRDNPKEDEDELKFTRTRILTFLQNSFAAHVRDMAAVSVGDLDYDDAVVFAQARRVCRIMEHVFIIALMEPPSPDLAEITNTLKQYAHDAKVQAKALRTSHRIMRRRRRTA